MLPVFVLANWQQLGQGPSSSYKSKASRLGPHGLKLVVNLLLGCGEGNMVLMPVSRLLLLLFVSVQCTSDNDLPDEDAAAEWENLSNTVSKDASFGHYFLGRSAPSAEFYDPPASMPVSEAETLKELFKPGGPTRPLDPRIKNMLLQAKAPPPTAAPVRPPVEALCHVDLMFLRIRKDIFSQNVRGDLRFGKCQVTLMSPEHYYFYIFLNQDCGIQKEVCAALSL